MQKIMFVLGLIMLLSACNQSKPKVSWYYKATNWNSNCPRLPLYEPLAIYKDLSTPPKWFMSFNDLLSSKKDKIDYHSIGANIISINHIGVNNGIVYGCINESTVKIEGYSLGDFVYMNNEGSPSWTSDSTYKHQEGEIVATILDTVNKVVMVPERWYIINTKDTTYNFFFDKKNYQAELKELKVSAHMYNIDSVYNQFVREGVLPWFPDSIKVALNK
ncbi:MAG: hypothetical protein JKX79_03395 [Labilibaculum sp.]|nr:hypothetical protein [Labilibaculum sp.]